MAVITVVRNLTCLPLHLAGVHKPVRPWHFTELQGLTSAQCDELSRLQLLKKVQLSQVVDGAPLTTVKLIPTVT